MLPEHGLRVHSGSLARTPGLCFGYGTAGKLDWRTSMLRRPPNTAATEVRHTKRQQPIRGEQRRGSQWAPGSRARPPPVSRTVQRELQRGQRGLRCILGSFRAQTFASSSETLPAPAVLPYLTFLCFAKDRKCVEFRRKSEISIAYSHPFLSSPFHIPPPPPPSSLPASCAIADSRWGKRRARKKTKVFL